MVKLSQDCNFFTLFGSSSSLAIWCLMQAKPATSSQKPFQLHSVSSQAVAYGEQPLLALGNQHLLAQPALALFCSAAAPPGVVLAIHDLAHRWRKSGPLIAGGFQSPAEDEALTVLLRGPQPVIVWLARGAYREVPARFRQALAENRLLLVSPFANNVRRATAETAFIRNRLCAATAQTVLIAHAQPGSKTELLARELLEWGKCLTHLITQPIETCWIWVRCHINNGATIIATRTCANPPRQAASRPIKFAPLWTFTRCMV
jgi:hypothetical protein